MILKIFEAANENLNDQIQILSMIIYIQFVQDSNLISTFYITFMKFIKLITFFLQTFEFKESLMLLTTLEFCYENEKNI